MKKITSFFVLMAFLISCVMPPQGFAQTLTAVGLMARPGDMVGLSQPYNPPVLRGIKVFANNPLKFDFILDPGDGKATFVNSKIDLKDKSELAEVSNRLIKYFLTTLTVPDDDIWVNLSPYEKERITTEKFGQTEMGRDLLAQDYLLKQITASLMYPEGEAGKKFWARIYEEAHKKFGSTNIPVDTFNKVWIMPEKAIVYEKQDNAKGLAGQATAFVVESRLKVMLESDYIALKGTKAAEVGAVRSASTDTQELAKDVVREVILPLLQKEVNEGENFAALRQVYNSIILALWYKEKLKGSILSSAYVDRNKVRGVDVADKAAAEKIWQQYVEAFKKGAVNLVREEKDLTTNEATPRKYFAGGFAIGNKEFAQIVDDPNNGAVKRFLKKAAVVGGLGLLLLVAGCTKPPEIEMNPPNITNITATFRIIPGIPGYSVTETIGGINGEEKAAEVKVTVKPSENGSHASYTLNLQTGEIKVEDLVGGVSATASFSVNSTGYVLFLEKILAILQSPMMLQRENGPALQAVLDDVLAAVNGFYIPATEDFPGYIAYNIAGNVSLRILHPASRTSGNEYYLFNSGNGSITIAGFVSSQSASGGGVFEYNYPVGSAGYRDALYSMIWALRTPGLYSRETKARLNKSIGNIVGQTGGVFVPDTVDFPGYVVTNVNGILEMTVIHPESHRDAGPQYYKVDLNTKEITIETYVPSQSASGGGISTQKYAFGSSGYEEALYSVIWALQTPGLYSRENKGTLDAHIADAVRMVGGIYISNGIDLKGYIITNINNVLKETIIHPENYRTSGPEFYSFDFNTKEIVVKTFVSSQGGSGGAVSTDKYAFGSSGYEDALKGMIENLRAPGDDADIAKILAALGRPDAGFKKGIKAPGDNAEARNKDLGGIDLKRSSMSLRTRNNGGAINFNVDPAMIESIKASPGLTPQVYTINPLESLPAFLGMSKEESDKVMADKGASS